MLLALVCTVCAKVATSTGGGDVGLVRALVILGQANTDMMESCWAGAQLLLPIRSVHRSVYLSLYPLKISLPLKNKVEWVTIYQCNVQPWRWICDTMGCVVY